MTTRTKSPLRSALAGTALAALLLTAGCATPTPYRPAPGIGGINDNGYSDQQIESNRYRVMFSGNSLTSRETVERYLLYRAAELTLEKGYDYFIMADRDTEKDSRTYVNQPFGFGPYAGWSPYWRFYRPAWGWGGWGPYGDPFWGNQVDVRTVDRYQAMTEIVMGKGPKPADNVRAFDARSVIDNLGPTIKMPKDG
ncbi:CC0125/CC1285 family lipoprotein [Stakelama pacifica]|uniref:DUF4136 domain-containing protein n=1 Tax=Stakelama pacifica TaxID=517720 RepID=A0A4R6FHK4_9SPHN|nr:hypothetical protein [Stakelama pacifica]TDN79955.1 hypothetical protein EV664_111112 [Stakelama pacifica]GGO98322.1 hypothetical protein GCM10011329_29210 [Stakelama pacifica]